MRRRALCLAILAFMLLALPAQAARRGEKAEESKKEDAKLSAGTFAGLSLRSIGPAISGGRIGDIAVDPTNQARWIVAVASGHVFETHNSGTTWKPIFDQQDSYSIGCVTLDPNNPQVIWVGTGENNSQRSVSYGDGVYRSLDGGKTWKNVGLKESEHIAKILVDPRDSNVVYVASQGPLWSEGGDRGLYKSTDRGESWELILEIDEHTGVTDIAFDPRDPDVIYAAAYQRGRRVWTLVNGGPGSALYKSTDAGKSFRKLTTGLPKGEMGRIGLAVSPANPDVVYAIIEAAEDKEEGFYRSVDRGESWEKMSSYMASSPQYYNEIVADPHDVDRVYSLDTWMHVTEDGGRNFRNMRGWTKHVDDHALWINPDDPRHLVNGNDGGVYESWDQGKTWHFKPNLPILQCYRVTADNDAPFYNVYCGTQDNATLGGPTRTRNPGGIYNEHWFVTVFGDGFKTQIDPTDPNIIYSQWQYGGLVRHDRASGQIVDIQPQPMPDDEALKWNWNSPLIISPHDHKRLYYAAQRLFRSDDRGNSWRPVSGDLTRRLDRNELEIMGKTWGVDAVSKHASTSFYGNIVSLSESPLVEGLLYVGTDDGLVQVSEDGGESWRKVESFPGVPELTYVSHVEASLSDADTVYATFDNHKRGDFKPYVLVSRDRGDSWSAITSDLPERGSVHVLKQDHVDPELLFVGTEFGVFFSPDEGGKWIKLSGGIPKAIAVRDLDVQRRENDLVVGTFGRGIYVLDDYSPLRGLSEEQLGAEALTFPVKDPLVYIETARLGLRNKAFQGDSFFHAPNPPFGAVLTYYLNEVPKTLEATRREAEKEAGGARDPYPTIEELRAEKREEEPVVVVTVRDDEGEVVRRFETPARAGFNRINWDLRYPSLEPVQLERRSTGSPWDQPAAGPMAVPGTYSIALELRHREGVKELGEPQAFDAEPLVFNTLATDDREALLAFQKETARLQRAVLGAVRVARDTAGRLAHLKQAAIDTRLAAPELRDRVRGLELELMDLQAKLTGDPVRASHQVEQLPSILGRVQRVVGGHWSAESAPTETHRKSVRIAGELFSPVLAELRTLVEEKIPAIERELEELEAPYTPGRLPVWEPAAN